MGIQITIPGPVLPGANQATQVKYLAETVAPALFANQKAIADWLVEQAASVSTAESLAVIATEAHRVANGIGSLLALENSSEAKQIRKSNIAPVPPPAV